MKCASWLFSVTAVAASAAFAKLSGPGPRVDALDAKLWEQSEWISAADAQVADEIAAVRRGVRVRVQAERDVRFVLRGCCGGTRRQRGQGRGCRCGRERCFG